MRLATIQEGDRPCAAVVRDDRVLPLALPEHGLASVRAIAGAGPDALARIGAWLETQPADAWMRLDDVVLAPAIPDPGAIYTIGLNYRTSDDPDDAGRPPRPLVYGKAATSVTGHRGTVSWDRSLTPNVDAECELAIVVGTEAAAIAAGDALDHVFGYTIVDDISSRDPWLDGDQWLVGKSMPGFCPVGPWIVTADELDPAGLRLGCTIGGVAIQDGTTADMRYSVAEIVSYLSRHATLRPGDLIATGTPERLTGSLGPERHLEPGDVVTTWIERIGELTVTVA
jgi:2-keto-4-pentenoate hydratase/2-oxohepta-3-ene-1,7-dioic acid hydratase in catechol pathway